MLVLRACSQAGQGTGLLLELGLGYVGVRFAQVTKCAARFVKHAH